VHLAHGAGVHAKEPDRRGSTGVAGRPEPKDATGRVVRRHFIIGGCEEKKRKKENGPFFLKKKMRMKKEGVLACISDKRYVIRSYF
jgi:hypothetical protein